MSNKISGVTVKIDGLNYTYEAHSLNRVVEILASQLAVLKGGVNEHGQQQYIYEIENFTVNYFD